MDKEAFYDTQIAPVLMQLAKRCEDAGLSFLAVVEWEPGEQGRTCVLQSNSGLGIRHALAAAQAQGNVDSLIMSLMKHGRKRGHGSILLRQLGVPATPTKAAQLTMFPTRSTAP